MPKTTRVKCRFGRLITPGEQVCLSYKEINGAAGWRVKNPIAGHRCTHMVKGCDIHLKWLVDNGPNGPMAPNIPVTHPYLPTHPEPKAIVRCSNNHVLWDGFVCIPPANPDSPTHCRHLIRNGGAHRQYLEEKLDGEASGGSAMVSDNQMYCSACKTTGTHITVYPKHKLPYHECVKCGNRWAYNKTVEEEIKIIRHKEWKVFQNTVKCEGCKHGSMIVGQLGKCLLLTCTPWYRESAKGKTTDYHTTRVVKAKVVEQVKIEKVEVEVKMPSGESIYLREDGNTYHKPESYGAQSMVPMSWADYMRAMGVSVGVKEKDVKINPTLLRKPSTDWRIPTKVLRAWGRVMASYDTEVGAIYGKRRDGGDESKPEWMVVIPKQECTSCTLDVDDTGPAASLLSKLGYRRVGSIHTHPGDGTGCSGVDREDLWTDFGGIHYIVGKTGGSVGAYYTMSGVSWRLLDKAWEYPKLFDIKEKPAEARVVDESMVSETGGKRIGKMISKPKATTTHRVWPPVGGGKKNKRYQGYQGETRRDKKKREKESKNKKVFGSIKEYEAETDWLDETHKLLKGSPPTIEAWEVDMVRVYTIKGITYGRDKDGDNFVWSVFDRCWMKYEYPTLRKPWDVLYNGLWSNGRWKDMGLHEMFHLIPRVSDVTKGHNHKRLGILRQRMFGLSNAYENLMTWCWFLRDIEVKGGAEGDDDHVVSSIGRRMGLMIQNDTGLRIEPPPADKGQVKQVKQVTAITKRK